jgi:aminopeptidase-like protein
MTGIGAELHRVAGELFPICRSITGDGVRQTIGILTRHFAPYEVTEVPSGTQCFDWTVPDEWTIRGARLTGPDGKTVVDFSDSNLHVVGYSEPVDATLDLDALQPHLHSLEALPDAIPYVTSYYARSWGFCLPHRQRARLAKGTYRAVIDSTLAPGSLTLAECVVPGERPDEVLISSYVCHPSMANNELSGPLVASAIARWLGEAKRRYTYRIALFPETIGSIVYLSRRLDHLKARLVAGFHLSCIGDERAYSFVATPGAETYADRVARHVYKATDPQARECDFLERGSDERQFCSPNAGLPVVTLMRSRFGSYPEYHTSLDDLTLVTPAGLEGGFQAVRRCIETIEAGCVPRATRTGEPQLRKYGLRPDISTRDLGSYFQLVSDVLAFADGRRDLVALCERIRKPAWEVAPVIARLESHGLIERLPLSATAHD